MSLLRTSFVLALGLLAACSGQSSPPSDGDSTGSEITASSGPQPQLCDAQPAPTARCGAACPYGYKGAAGTYTCECCTGPAVPEAGTDTGSDSGADADAGQICGGPPPNARCMACPGGGNSYKQIDGQPTCECCSP